FCMDAGLVRRYLAQLAEHRLTERLSVLIGIVPLRSARSARWIKEKLFGAVIPEALIDRMERAKDPAAEGRRICIDMVRELAEMPQVAGVHIMAPGNDAAVPEVIKAARNSVKRLAPVWCKPVRSRTFSRGLLPRIYCRRCATPAWQCHFPGREGAGRRWKFQGAIRGWSGH